MQTQVHQMSKKNKVTVPFYSPPFRLHGQTPADIIKEARAAVMTPPPVCIKPVHTSRPFTPNEKERTLFGKLKKNSRPPSSFSLRHLKSQDPPSRVKLPSIEIVSRSRKFSTFHYSKNLSLDNLTEDYDAEAFEELKSKSTDSKALPTWKKVHSCPKEGRLSKVASLNDLSRSFDSISHKVNHDEYSGAFDIENVDAKIDSYDFCSSKKASGNKVKSEHNTDSFVTQNPIMTKGGGDYEMITEVKNDVSQESGGKIGTATHIGDSDVKSEPKSQETENQIIDKDSEEESSAKNHNAITSQESQSAAENSPSTTVEEGSTAEEKEEIGKPVTVAEKSVFTEFKSEYLTSLKTGFKSPEIIKQSKSVPQEILDLYETARFYGVDVNQNGGGASSAVESSNKCSSKENSEKKLNVGSEVGENSKTPADKSEVLKKTSSKETIQESSETVEFSMNNKKRYHTVASRGLAEKKAYKIWNNKQEMNDQTQPPSLNNSWDIFWKNSYFVEKSEKNEGNNKDENLKHLQQLLSKLTGLVKEEADTGKIYETTSQIYDLIKNKSIVLDSNLKKNISRCLYLCVDIENVEVLLSIAKIFFYLKEESSLSVACKLIFKVARFDTNDHLFLREEDILELFLEGIGRASPLDCAESCIYSYGALKFLTLNYNILSRILHLGALDLMALHLKIINNAYIENGAVGEQTQHALFQLTGALRHVAAGEGALPLFLTTNSIAIVCTTLRCFLKDEDVVVNISRTLSLLSTDETVTQALMQVENVLSIVVELIDRYKENDKILIRLAFCLGNIVEHSDLARVQLSRSDTALNVLLNVLKLYIDKDLEISLKEENNDKLNGLSSEVIDDVIVKVIRIIANMSMNPIVGSNLSPATKEKKSIQLSKLLSVLLMRKDPGITLLATLGCLNNISYYCNTHSVLVDITQGVERVLGLESVECQTEAARVLGNLTRHREIRDLILSTGGVDLLIKLLSSPDQEVVRCTCGALLNMLLDSETRKRFVEAQGIDKLVKTLEIFPDEWSLASLVVRAIWNSCGDDVSSAMLHNNVENLLNLLASSLEEENWNDGDVAWEEFASVATDLLEKISLHLEST